MQQIVHVIMQMEFAKCRLVQSICGLVLAERIWQLFERCYSEGQGQGRVDVRRMAELGVGNVRTVITPTDLLLILVVLPLVLLLVIVLVVRVLLLLPLVLLLLVVLEVPVLLFCCQLHNHVTISLKSYRMSLTFDISLRVQDSV